ncbi:MAG: hypothetical protein HY686_00550 [Chloroflexi bacterium]|nr:hypothetical protein [Chloroflexota bacterium]
MPEATPLTNAPRLQAVLLSFRTSPLREALEAALSALGLSRAQGGLRVL